MSRKTASRLTGVIRIRRLQEESAARTLHDLTSRKFLQERRLHQLQTYCDEYRSGYSKALDQGSSALALAEYRTIIQTLDSAIRQEQNNLQFLLEHWRQGRQRWQEAKTRAAVTTEIRDLHRQKQDHREQAIEQLGNDDLAGSAGLRRG